MNIVYEIVVGGSGQYDQPAGSTSFPIGILSGVSGYVEKRGIGRLSFSEYTVLPGGGFSVPNPTTLGEVFYFIPNFFIGSITSGWYTNGFDFPKVIAVLGSRIGWKDEDSIVESYNMVSRSGRFFNDGSFHPIVTVQNIKETIGSDSVSNSAFNTALQNLTRGAIMSCLTNVFNSEELIDDTWLFDRDGDDSTVNNSGKFVGVRFRVLPRYALQANTIQLYFDGVATFNLYLYHESKQTPIWQQSVTSAAGEVVTVDLSTEIILTHLLYGAPGSYYLGYYQDDLNTVKAIDEDGCINAAKVARIRFIEADKSLTSFDRNTVVKTTQTYGLNMNITTFKDHTDNIIKQAHLFDNAIGLQVAHNVAKMVMYSVRSNKDQRILRTELDKMGLQYELDGKVPISDVPKSFGLQDKINAELKRVRESFNPSPKSQSVSLC